MFIYTHILLGTCMLSLQYFLSLSKIIVYTILNYVLNLTLVPVSGGHCQHSCSRSFVFHHVGFKLCSMEHWSLIVHVNHLHTQHLRGGKLRYPTILCYNGQIEDFLLFPVQSF